MDKQMEKQKALNIFKEVLDMHFNGDLDYISLNNTEFLQALQTVIDYLESYKIEFESPKKNNLEKARVVSQFKVNSGGYYIDIKKGTRVIIDNATQELYGITDSVTMEILKGIVLEKE